MIAVFLLVVRNSHSFPTRRSSDLTRTTIRAIRSPGACGCPVDPSGSSPPRPAPVREHGAAGCPAWDTRPRRRTPGGTPVAVVGRSDEHTSELQSRENLVCRLLLVK